MTRRAHGQGDHDPARGRRAGFGIVELLVAAGIGAVVLAASWGWLWTVGSAARGMDDSAQVGSIAEAASRGLTRDVRLATAVLPPPDARDPEQSLLLRHDEPGSATETVLIVWDPARDVLWRNASGTYLSDHVTLFRVSYVSRDGRWLRGSEVGADEWGAISMICLELSVGMGERTEYRALEIRVGPS